MLAVFGGTGLGYFLEKLLLGDVPSVSWELAGFATLTVFALFFLVRKVCITARHAESTGVFLHYALLPDPNWRARHEGERDGMRRWVNRQWPTASVLPSRITDAASGSESPEGQVVAAVSDLKAVLLNLGQLVPGQTAVNLLIGARQDVAVVFGAKCAEVLPETFWLVADARDSRSLEGYHRYTVTAPQASTAPQESPRKDGGTTAICLQFDNLQEAAFAAFQAFAADKGAVKPWVIGPLATTQAAYEEALRDITRRLEELSAGEVIIVGNGPQSVMFAAGVIAARLGFVVKTAQFQVAPPEPRYLEPWGLSAESRSALWQGSQTATFRPLVESLGTFGALLVSAVAALLVQWWLGRAQAAGAVGAMTPKALVVAAVAALLVVAATSIAWQKYLCPRFWLDFSDATPPTARKGRVLRPPTDIPADDRTKIASWIKARLNDVHAVAPAVVNIAVVLPTGIALSADKKRLWNAIGSELTIGASTNVPIDFFRDGEFVRLIKRDDKLWPDV